MAGAGGIVACALERAGAPAITSRLDERHRAGERRGACGALCDARREAATGPAARTGCVREQHEQRPCGADERERGEHGDLGRELGGLRRDQQRRE